VGCDEVILLDTHAAIWLIANDPSLGSKSREVVLEAQSKRQLAVSAISFWEIALLISKHRLKLSDPTEQMREELLATGVKELPVTGEIALNSVALDGLPGDPADRFIAATALVHQAALLTADRKLLEWKSKLVLHDARK
jgi:PIN domain nuclease of toxin-antitoxin system